MSTFNGEKYLRTQLDSILNQKGVIVDILVRDDGSNDKTTAILEEYRSRKLLEWYKGNNIKPAKSFIDLIFNAYDADFYAFSDQDDFWLPNKLLSAITKLEFDENLPSLYCSSTTLVDHNLKDLNYLDNRIPSININTAFVINTATGCTMVFNRKLLNIIKIYNPKFLIMHDGWINKICLSVGGYLYYDKNSFILYRQHNNNVIGGKKSFYKSWKMRFGYLFFNSKMRSTEVKELYTGYSHLMTKDCNNICKKIINYDKSIANRIRLLMCKDIRGTNISTTIKFKAAVLLGIY